jgi:hypothetical protein
MGITVEVPAMTAPARGLYEVFNSESLDPGSQENKVQPECEEWVLITDTLQKKPRAKIMSSQRVLRSMTMNRNKPAMSPVTTADFYGKGTPGSLMPSEKPAPKEPPVDPENYPSLRNYDNMLYSTKRVVDSKASLSDMRSPIAFCPQPGLMVNGG